MYNVTFIHLAPGAVSAALEWDRREQRDVSGEEMRQMLESFTAIDPVDNATADPEIRVQVRAESYFIRTGQKKLILYDALNREIPGQYLTVDEVMAELDGTAMANRTAVPFLFGEQLAAANDIEPARMLPAVPINRTRVTAMAVAVVALAGVHAWLWFSGRNGDAAPAFTRLGAQGLAATQATMTGVYLTGTEPGQHGIALTSEGEVRLFELRGVDAPGVVHASGQWGRVEGGLALVTDQPGGLVLAPDADTLVYCGETYKRVP